MAEDKKNKVYSHPLAERVLLKIQTTPDKATRAKMVKALAGLRQPWTLPLLLACLNDPSDSVREKIVGELSSWNELPLAELHSRLQKQPWYVKAAVLKILGRLAKRDSVEAIAGVIDDPNVEVRRQAALCLGEIAAKETLPLLVKLLKDASPYVRQAAELGIRKASKLRFT